MTIRPLYDRVLVRRVEAETRTDGGIVLPDSATEKPNQGEVVAAGPGHQTDSGDLRPLAVKPGDRVLFGSYAGSSVTVDGEELLVLRESDILAVIEAAERLENAA